LTAIYTPQHERSRHACPAGLRVGRDALVDRIRAPPIRGLV